MQASGAQSITVEDSMSMVHASAGRLCPASPQLRSEPAIVAGMAAATLDHSKVDWNGLVADYDRIRDLIERTIPGFDGYNERIRVPGGFRMPLPPTERRWPTPPGKAMFSVFPGVRENTSPGPTMCCASSPSAAMTSTTPPSTAWTTAIEACSADGTCCSCIPPTWPSAAEHGDLIEIQTISANRALRLGGITVIEYDIARGSVAAYYPEANVLVPLDYIDEESGTPSYKSIPVRILRQETAQAA